MTDNPVRWFEIYVQDMTLAKHFYESVFRVKLEKLHIPGIEIWAFPMQKGRPGATGSLVRMDGVPSGGNSTLVYFACEDCAVEAARVAEFGGRVDHEKKSVGEYGFIALVVDPDGNTFGLHSMQ